MKIPNYVFDVHTGDLSLARIVSEDSQRGASFIACSSKSSKDS